MRCDAMRSVARIVGSTQHEEETGDRADAGTASLSAIHCRMKIKKLPNILALHLKRFKYQEDVQRFMKLGYRVVFPFELRLFNTVDDAPNADRLYRLWAIVVHIGA